MDRQFKKSALTIGVRMAALSGAMVLVGAVLFSAAPRSRSPFRA